ncbi:MAG: acylneuraminate cytidylyltransferase family protein [Bacteroidota bacterium]
MNILAIIPARGGSKGIPGKNTKLLGDKPLIAYSIEAALASKHIHSTIVSTDDETIAAIAKQFGADVPFVRPSELATDSARSVDVVLHAIDFVAAQGKHFDAICLLQPTTPFRAQGFIDTCIRSFIKQQVDSLVSVQAVPHEYNPHWIFEPDTNGHLHIATGEESIIPRRQELPKAYIRDGSVYITKVDVLTNQHSLYGKTIGYIESDAAYHVNIDTPEDWALAETFIAHRK